MNLMPNNSFKGIIYDIFKGFITRKLLYLGEKLSIECEHTLNNLHLKIIKNSLPPLDPPQEVTYFQYVV